jgi:hypothetical protein
MIINLCGSNRLIKAYQDRDEVTIKELFKLV